MAKAVAARLRKIPIDRIREMCIRDSYKALEAALRNKINNIERTHSGYDEYRYDLEDVYKRQVLASGVQSICLRATATITPAQSPRA